MKTSYLCDRKVEKCKGKCNPFGECFCTLDPEHAARDKDGNPIIVIIADETR